MTLWPPDAKNSLTGKDPDAGNDWRQEEKRMTEDEMVGWHHRLDGHEFEQAPGFDDGQESLACCSPWGQKELDTTEWLNWTEQEDSDVGIHTQALESSYYNSLTGKKKGGLPWCLRGKGQCRRDRFDPWIRKIPWRRRQLTSIFLSGKKSLGQRNLVGYSRVTKELDTIWHLNNSNNRKKWSYWTKRWGKDIWQYSTPTLGTHSQQTRIKINFLNHCSSYQLFAL